MQQSNGKLSSTAYADHLRGCADLSVEIAQRMDIRDDSARQACFATVIINAERHNIFMEPVPRNTKTPVIQPEPAVASKATTEGGNSKQRDEAAAAKADGQIKDIAPNPTPETAAAANRSVLLDAIDKGRNALNKAGHLPIMTPKALNDIINTELNIPGNLGTLDTDQLELVAKMLSDKLDNFKHNLKSLEADAPF